MASFKIRQIPFWSLVLALLAGAAYPLLAEPENTGDTQQPVLKQPLYLNVPRELWHLSSSWEYGKMRLRIGPDGRVMDWIPLSLPHFGLVDTLDKALTRARFTEPVFKGEPVIVDIMATIPLYDVIGSVVLSVTMAEHIESRFAGIVPSHFQLVESGYSELDEPPKLISVGQSYTVTDDNGVPLSGTVKVEFYIDPDGRPRMMVPDEAADPYLAQAAAMTIANMRFTPPRRNGHPTVVKVRMPVVIGE